MPGDLAVAPVAAYSPTQKAAQGSGAKSPEPAHLNDSPRQAGPSSAAATPVLPNPSMSIDPGLGLVVMEFHNDAGKVTSTIPTQKQLDSYRQARMEDTTIGSGTPGGAKAGTMGGSSTHATSQATTAVGGQRDGTPGIQAAGDITAGWNAAQGTARDSAAGASPSPDRVNSVDTAPAATVNTPAQSTQP